MSRVNIPVSELEFEKDGKTIWVHSPDGGTVLRIKCSGKIIVDKCETSPVAHGDIMIKGDINLCIPKHLLKK